MKNILKKIYVPIAGTLIALTPQLNADSCCKPSSCCSPSCCDQEDGVYFKGDLLYWRAELCGLQAAFGTTTIATTINPGNVTTTVIESDKEPHFKWNTGFRVGGDVMFNCFDLEADWTHFKGHANFRDHGQHGRWKIKYDTIDLTLGRWFCATPSFTLKPFIGVRGAEIHNRLNSHLETLFTALIGDNTVATDKNDREKFRGIGPLLGVEADWEMGCNFSLYGSFDIVTYYGTVRGRNYDVDYFTSTTSVSDGRRKHCFDNIGTDGAIGIRWDDRWCICDYMLSVMLKVGAEQHRIYEFSNLGSDGTLSLDGAVFGAGIGFTF